MKKYFFLADTHFGSEKIFHYENRPFETVEQMNESIVNNRNDTVSENDIVWFL
jgi:calcineurin-like phosphoesterase family protein